MKKFLTAFDLKILAVVFMIIDHFAYFLPSYLPGNLALYLRYSARIVAPIFIFLAVESFFHTRNKQKYLLRLYLAALIMLIGNMIMEMIVKNEFQPIHLMGISQNIFLTIAVGVSIVAAFEWMKKTTGYQRILPFLAIYFLSIAALFVESSFYGLFMFYVFYFFRGKKIMFVVYSILPIVMLVWQLVLYQGNFWFHDFRWFILAAIPFLMLYNGEKGHGLKYFFYIIYPLNIWLLYYLSYALLSK
ncbi:MAG: TraX family protein [Patescibacteria group bacterium]